MKTSEWRAIAGVDTLSYTMYKGAPEVYRSSQEIRELIVEWVERHRRVPGEPTNNWRVIAVPR